MPSSNTELFDLIHSLDKNERRYLKLFAQNLGSQSSNYIKLFDAIARQKEYDEAKLKRKFRTEKFVKKLSASKQYLTEFILKTMQNYHTGQAMEVALDGLISTTRTTK